MRGRHSADRAGGAADIAVDMMDNASALPTCPQRQQQEKTAFRKWPKITHTTSRRGNYLLNRMELSDRSPGCMQLPEGDRAMNPPDEFLKCAADCEQMAKFARDPESKATWNRMAERWRRCAEKFTSESLAAHQAMAAKRRQGVAPDWAHH
jgi:hypothetical protein